MKLALDTSAYKALGEGNQQLAEESRTAEAVGVPMIVLGDLWSGFMNGIKLRENAATLERFHAQQVLGLEVIEFPMHLPETRGGQ